MPTNDQIYRTRTIRRPGAEAEILLSKRRTWFDDDGAGDDGNGGGTTPPSGEPSNLQTVPMSEFKRLQGQYAGLRAHVDNELKPQVATLQQQLTANSQQYEAQVTTLTGERDTAQGELTTAQGELEQANTSLSNFKQRQEVGALIAKDYPGLTQAHAQGLINTAGLEGEVLDNHLKGLSQFVAGQAEQAVDQTLAGSTPPTPTGISGAGMSAAQLGDRLLAMDPNDPQYAATEEAYFQALDAADKTSS